MLKWYEEVGLVPGSNYISSRIRLSRNWEEYLFPGKLGPAESGQVVGLLTDGLRDLAEAEKAAYRFSSLDRMGEAEKMAMKERRLLNAGIAAKKLPVGVILSEREDVSLLLNGDDHIRIQLLGAGRKLEELWERASRIDDHVSRRFNYAFDEKYGYLTAFPTNVGTGMRANIVLHLPSVSLGKTFRTLVDGMSRFGVTIRGVYGQGRDNHGSLFDICNTKTLGLTEEDIIKSVLRTAAQLDAQERRIREISLKEHRTAREDETFKSYGVLKYARRLSAKEAMIYLSQLMAGIDDGLVTPAKPCSIYKLMVEIQPYNLMCRSERPMEEEEIDIFRAEYIRSVLPEIKED